MRHDTTAFLSAPQGKKGSLYVLSSHHDPDVLDGGSYTMNRVRFENLLAATAVTEEGWHIAISHGPVEGLLRVSPFIHPQLCSADMGYFQVSLVFRSASGEPFEYSAILPCTVLWPSRKVVCAPANEMIEADLVISTVLDTREGFEIHLTDGSTMEGVFKHMESRFQVRIHVECLDVRLTFYWAKAREYRTVAYQVPLSSLMWRQATVFWADDFSAQGANHVNIKRWDSGGIDAAPSPVEINQSED
jgi:hypothetical protein